MDLYTNAAERVTGAVQFIHQFVDMQSVQVAPEFSSTGQAATTCQVCLSVSH
jgi:hypothetical protein